MIFPNVEIFDKQGSIYFHNDGFDSVNRYKFYSNVYPMKDDDAFMVVSQEFTNTRAVIDYIKAKGYKRLFIVIDDVLRDHVFHTNKQEEFKAIKAILANVKLDDYKIYHCEFLNQQKIQNPFGQRIEFFDLFLPHWIKENQYERKLTQNFNYKVSFFNNRGDYHRQFMSAMLAENSDINLTMNEIFKGKQSLGINHISIKHFSNNFRKQLKKNLIRFEDVHHMHVDKNNKELSIITDHAAQHDNIVIKWIEDSFVNLVGETTYFYPHQYISEKTLKPMMAYRPFILLAPVGTLKQLKAWGFKTFDKWWDEDYDLIEDPYQRLEKVYELIQDVLKKEKAELKEMLIEMKSVLEHNRETLERLPHLIWESIF